MPSCAVPSWRCAGRVHAGGREVFVQRRRMASSMRGPRPDAVTTRALADVRAWRGSADNIKPLSERFSSQVQLSAIPCVPTAAAVRIPGGRTERNQPEGGTASLNAAAHHDAVRFAPERHDVRRDPYRDIPRSTPVRRVIRHAPPSLHQPRRARQTAAPQGHSAIRRPRRASRSRARVHMRIGER